MEEGDCTDAREDKRAASRCYFSFDCLVYARANLAYFECLHYYRARGKDLLIDRSDRLGFTIPGGIVRYRETVEECVRREAREETGYDVQITSIVGVYSALDRDPRFRAASIAYRGHIVGGMEHHSNEGQTCWCEPESVLGRMAFDCEQMLKDYLCGRQCLS